MDVMDQKFRLEVDGVQASIVMAALKQFAEDHGHEEEARPMVAVLEGIQFERVE